MKTVLSQGFKEYIYLYIIYDFFFYGSDDLGGVHTCSLDVFGPCCVHISVEPHQSSSGS